MKIKGSKRDAAAPEGGEGRPQDAGSISHDNDVEIDRPVETTGSFRGKGQKK